MKGVFSVSKRVTKYELDERSQIVPQNPNLSNIHLIHLHRIPVQHYQIRYFTFFKSGFIIIFKILVIYIDLHNSLQCCVFP